MIAATILAVAVMAAGIIAARRASKAWEEDIESELKLMSDSLDTLEGWDDEPKQ